jgi:DNA-binding MurR/RpiR family transcriptional regulator
MPQLTGASRRIGESVLADPRGLSTSSIGEVAARSGTSAASVTRFCRALGFSGYGEFRVGLAADLAHQAGAGWEVDVGASIAPDDPTGRVVAVIRALGTATINDTVAQLDLAAVDTVAAALAEAGRVDLFGIGGSGTLAVELQQRLHRIGRPAWCSPDPHAALTSAALLGPGDVLVGFTHSGRTTETVDVLAEAARRGAATVAVTNFPRSPAAEAADHVLTTSVRDTTFGPETIAARHAALIVIDCVYIAVAQRTYPRTTEAFRRTTEAVSGHRGSQVDRSRRRRDPAPGR